MHGSAPNGFSGLQCLERIGCMGFLLLVRHDTVLQPQSMLPKRSNEGAAFGRGIYTCPDYKMAKEVGGKRGGGAQTQASVLSRQKHESAILSRIIEPCPASLSN